MRTLPALLLLAVAASGCTSFELTSVRNDLARQLPEAAIGEGYAVSFGRISIGFTRWLTSFADDEDAELAQIALREVRRVQFGRYDVTGPVDASRLTMPSRLRHYVEDEGWQHLATFREGAEAGWVLYRERDEGITDLFAVVLSEEELVLARLSGDLDDLVVNVLRHERHRLPLFREAASEEEAEAVGAVLEAAQAVGG
ncbi:MAG TPA: DUF4252 domain-containing protein [Rubricoccaceae bacterium]|nr:DUF4252 domain-containing protein [Rubricoccaceae bacterium]